MSKLRRILLIRHGETSGSSSIRFYGSTDVELSDEGRLQMRDVARSLRTEVFDLIVASPLRRSWEAASIAAGGSPVRLESDFREIDFGRWEGMTAQEIEASDPVLYRDWQAQARGFEFPSGEPRSEFRERVHRGLARLQESGATSVLAVVHKGVIRALAEKLLGEPLADGEPAVAGKVPLSLGADGRWFLGRRSSNPPGLGEATA